MLTRHSTEMSLTVPARVQKKLIFSHGGFWLKFKGSYFLDVFSIYMRKNVKLLRKGERSVNPLDPFHA